MSSLGLPVAQEVFVPRGYAADDGVSDAAAMDIGERIRKLRLERQQDQYEVAAAAKVSRVTVTQWEGGKKKPRRESLIAVARHFNIPVDYLLYGDRQPGQTKPETPEEERTLLLLRQATPAVRMAVQTLLENAVDANIPEITKKS